MAVSNAPVTEVYTLLATGKATFTVQNTGGGAILFNSTNADDSTAIPAHNDEGPAQFVQTADAIPTYARHTGAAGDDWAVIVDTNVS